MSQNNVRTLPLFSVVAHIKTGPVEISDAFPCPDGYYRGHYNQDAFVRRSGLGLLHLFLEWLSIVYLGRPYLYIL